MRRAMLAAVFVFLGACSGGGGDGRATNTPLPQGRPSSAAVVAIDKPANADTIKGPNVHVVIRLDGARIVAGTTTTVNTHEGHLLVTLDNARPFPGRLDMTIPNVAPGEHVIRVEFVASDNKPFDPRVESAVLFNVT